MSNNALGDATGETRTITVEGSSDGDTSAISAGDAVALDQSASDQQVPIAIQLIDSTTPNKDQELGVAAEDISDGSRGTVHVEGPCIANVAGSLSQGERVGAGATAGQFASQDDGPYVLLSDTAGTDRAGTNLGSNEGEVLL